MISNSKKMRHYTLLLIVVFFSLFNAYAINGRNAIEHITFDLEKNK